MLSLPAVFIFTFLCFTSIIAQDVLVNLPNGQVKGMVKRSDVNRTRDYYAFYSMRYAQPPVGNLRLQPPADLEPWSDVYDATYEKNMCYQVTSDSPLESEDCLFINVFSPQNPSESSELLPVMLFIHGGGFVEGTGFIMNGTTPDFFMDYGVLFASINYRLGPFGFLSTGDTVIPGNLGLKDQNAALRWVQKNIQYFGGDPKKVTLFGQSAGAASASYQQLSPKSAGLFRALILESGTAITPWAYQRDQVEITYQTAARINSEFTTNRNSSALLEFLMTADAKAIDQASYDQQSTESAANMQITQGFHYTPVIEVEHEDAFFTKRMYQMLEEGDYNKIPTIIGMNAEEGIFMMSDWLGVSLQDMDNHPAYATPFDMEATSADSITAGNAIRNYYTQNGGNWNNDLAGSIRYFTDQSFARSIVKAAELQSNHNDVYFYHFTYHGKMGNNAKELAGTGNVTHGEEQNYLLVRGVFNSDLSQFPEDDVITHYRFMSMWTNFAKTLNPIPEQNELFTVSWPTVNIARDGGFKFLNIGKNLNVQTNPKNKMVHFWNKLYDTYGIPPYTTY